MDAPFDLPILPVVSGAVSTLNISAPPHSHLTIRCPMQVTTAERHDVVFGGLTEALDVLPDLAEYRLYFVVPPDRFTSFKKQRIKAAPKGSQPGRVVRVRQSVLKLVI